jgi:hypothetical protein
MYLSGDLFILKIVEICGNILPAAGLKIDTGNKNEILC